MLTLDGVPVHGEFSSADASALTESGSRFALYGAGGTSAITLNANDYVSIDCISVSSGGTTLTISVYDGANATVDAGELVWRGIVPTSTSQFIVLRTPHTCQPGTWPKVKSSDTGQVDLVLHGTIYRHPV